MHKISFSALKNEFKDYFPHLSMYRIVKKNGTFFWFYQSRLANKNTYDTLREISSNFT